jgi:hypothetical protein
LNKLRKVISNKQRFQQGKGYVIPWTKDQDRRILGRKEPDTELAREWECHPWSIRQRRTWLLKQEEETKKRRIEFIKKRLLACRAPLDSTTDA